MVGMSGGVDSSSAALFLQQQGYDVCGVTLSLFSREAIGLPPCDHAESDDARAVADKLGIPHTVYSLEDTFRSQVIDRFAAVYQAGQTPNPCIECNRHIKFGKMLELALAQGQDKIATGHYARIVYDETRHRYLLLRAADRTKDQSYVLYTMTQFELAHTLFPLGDKSKAEIREIAEQHGLLTAHKKDSQDICFVPSGDYAHFLENVCGVVCPEGAYIDTAGREIGRHHGHIHYTIGQRKGLGMGFGKPMYVLAKDPSANTVTLGDEDALFTRQLTARQVNWIAVDPPDTPLRVTAKTRYSQADAPATVTALADGCALVSFDTPQRAVTAGQAVVFYDGDIVVGGGTIV